VLHILQNHSHGIYRSAMTFSNIIPDLIKLILFLHHIYKLQVGHFLSYKKCSFTILSLSISSSLILSSTNYPHPADLNKRFAHIFIIFQNIEKSFYWNWTLW
jgi:hypothetical protein